MSVRKAKSVSRIVNIGVPQGSILGPLLFLVYVNEIPSISQKFSTTMFADDCTLTFCDSNLNQLLSDCNDEIAHFKSWSDSNRLTINVDKTVGMLISNPNVNLPTNSIMLQDHAISNIQATKFLGIFVDNNLKYDTHIKFICNKISKSIGILYKIRLLVPKSCL